MAGSKSDYLENKILDLIFGGQALTPPTNLYFGLFTVAPSDAGGGTEVTGGSYARVSIANNLTNFPAASGGSKSNAAAVTWPTAGASWGTVVAVGVFDAPTGGNLLYWTTITNKIVDSGDTISIPTSGLTVTES